jgi:hypothetical protein
MSAYGEYMTPAVDNNMRPAKQCERCGQDIYFLKQNTRKRGEHWAAYHHRGHGGGGYKCLELHTRDACKKFGENKGRKNA